MPPDTGSGHITQIKAGPVLWQLEPENHFLFLPLQGASGAMARNPRIPRNILYMALIMSTFFLGGQKQDERGHMLCSRSPRVS